MAGNLVDRVGSGYDEIIGRVHCHGKIVELWKNFMVSKFFQAGYLKIKSLVAMATHFARGFCIFKVVEYYFSHTRKSHGILYQSFCEPCLTSVAIFVSLPLTSD